jgi:hypothetical protein
MLIQFAVSGPVYNNTPNYREVNLQVKKETILNGLLNLNKSKKLTLKYLSLN